LFFQAVNPGLIGFDLTRVALLCILFLIHFAFSFISFVWHHRTGGDG
jgi:hypothetical protein